MRTYKLVGKHAGQSIQIGNYSFVVGEIQIDDKMVETVGPVITRFYGAVPAEQWEAAQAAYERENKVKPEDSVLPRPPAPPASAAGDKDKNKDK